MSKIIALCLLLLVGLASAQETPKSGQIYQSLSYDLNGDGKAEKICLTAYNIQDESEGYWGRLSVVNSAGKTIWSAPKVTSHAQAFAFGSWPFGGSDLHWIGDIDGDGKTELISQAPVSDVRPPTYNRYRWNGKAFVALSPKMLLENPKAPGKFAWRDPIEWDGVQALNWVSGLSGGPQKTLAEIASSRPGGEYWSGQAEMKGDGLGLSVKTWLKKLGPNG